MQVVISDAGKLRKELTISYTKEELEQRKQSLFDKYASQIKMKGFRNGKVPKSLVKKRFGDSIQAESIDAMVNEGVRKGIIDNDLNPVGQFSEGTPDTSDGLNYATSFDIHPEVSLPSTDVFNITVEDNAVTDEEIAEELEATLRRAGENQDLDADAVLIEDDSVTLIGKITSGDETIREITDLRHLLGAYPLFGKDPKEVLELAKDLKTGDSLEFDTTLPEAFKPEEWANKEAHVSVTIQSALRLMPAELNEELLKRFGVENEEDLNARIKESIEGRKTNAAHDQQINELTEQLIEKSTLELPEKMYADMIEASLKDAADKKEGDEELTDDEKAEAEKNVTDYLRRMFILGTIAQENNIETTQEDLQQQIMMAAYRSGQKPEDIAKNLQESGQINQVSAEIREAKSLEFFLGTIIGTDEESTEEG